MANEAAAADRFAELGAPSVPALAASGRCVAGVDLAGVAELLGVEFDAAPALPLDVLVERLRLVLGAAMRLTGQFPKARLADKLPRRDRTCLALANHVVEIAAGLLEVADGADFSAEVSAAEPNVELEPVALRERAERISNALAMRQPMADRPAAAFFGETTFHAVLERCAWHAAQHTRQLAALLEGLGVEPERPLAPPDLDGLPVPAGVWD